MNKNNNSIILWFRNDLRLLDNNALNAAFESQKPIVPIFIYDYESFDLGKNAKEWQKASVAKLAKSIEKINGKLFVLKGNAKNILLKLCKENNCKTVFANRIETPQNNHKDNELAQTLLEEGIVLNLFANSLLVDPKTIVSGKGTPYSKFAPFYQKLLQSNILQPKQTPKNIDFYKGLDVFSEPLEKNIFYHQAGEEKALEKLEFFINQSLPYYKERHDFPSIENSTSKLSSHLAFGEISSKTIFYAVKGIGSVGEQAFLRQLIWRDFCYDLIFRYPDIKEKPIREEFAKFAWDKDEKFLDAWKNGLTGYPLVDAGMRELNETGLMHNRVRMVVASFLVKHLLIAWQEGEKWFWEKLTDADFANNPANWQWVSGCGVDSAPFFRIFNPTLQAHKFDAKQEYIKKWIPELSESKKGKYPPPIVDHIKARNIALKTYHETKAKLF